MLCNIAEWLSNHCSFVTYTFNVKDCLFTLEYESVQMEVMGTEIGCERLP